MSEAPNPAGPAPVPPTPAPAPAASAGPVEVTIQDFKKIELRTARIVAVENHPNADRLYVIQVEIGGTSRQVVAGIKPFYAPEQLVGKTVIVAANLKAAKLRGVESQGMILAVSAGESLSVLTTDRDVPSGLQVT